MIEYKIITYKLAEADLNYLGKEKWELIVFNRLRDNFGDKAYEYIFKRLK